MRTMAKALGLLLVVAFVAGLWDARYGQEERRPARAEVQVAQVEVRHRVVRPGAQRVSEVTLRLRPALRLGEGGVQVADDDHGAACV